MQPFTVEQARAARAFLGWSQHELGDAAGLSFETIRNFERDDQSATKKKHECNSYGISRCWRRISSSRGEGRGYYRGVVATLVKRAP